MKNVTYRRYLVQYYRIGNDDWKTHSSYRTLFQARRVAHKRGSWGFLSYRVIDTKE